MRVPFQCDNVTAIRFKRCGHPARRSAKLEHMFVPANDADGETAGVAQIVRVQRRVVEVGVRFEHAYRDTREAGFGEAAACRYCRTTSRGGPSAAIPPASIQRTRSQSCSINAVSCETITMVLPRSRKPLMRARHFSRKYASPTARISSTSRMSGSTSTAMEKPSRMYMPEEYCFT